MNVMIQGLAITGIGMGLVFLMILVLWGIMALLVSLTTRTQPPITAADEQQAELALEAEHKAEAVATAVAFALAQEKFCLEEEETTEKKPTNQWLLSGRLQQIQTSNRGRRG